jgi:hypothetical protein
MASTALAVSKPWKEAVSDGVPSTGYFLTAVDPWIKTWQERDKELLAIRRYKNDWDGLGTEAPNPGYIDQAREILEFLKRRNSSAPPARVSLTPNRSITFEWQSKGYYLEAELFGFERIEWMEAHEGEKAKFWIERLVAPNASEGQGVVWNPKVEAGAAVSVSGR